MKVSGSTPVFILSSKPLNLGKLENIVRIKLVNVSRPKDEIDALKVPDGLSSSLLDCFYDTVSFPTVNVSNPNWQRLVVKHKSILQKREFAAGWGEFSKSFGQFCCIESQIFLSFS